MATVEVSKFQVGETAIDSKVKLENGCWSKAEDCGRNGEESGSEAGRDDSREGEGGKDEAVANKEGWNSGGTSEHQRWGEEEEALTVLSRAELDGAVRDRIEANGLGCNSERTDIGLSSATEAGNVIRPSEKFEEPSMECALESKGGKCVGIAAQLMFEKGCWKESDEEEVKKGVLAESIEETGETRKLVDEAGCTGVAQEEGKNTKTTDRLAKLEEMDRENIVEVMEEIAVLEVPRGQVNQREGERTKTDETGSLRVNIKGLEEMEEGRTGKVEEEEDLEYSECHSRVTESSEWIELAVEEVEVRKEGIQGECGRDRSAKYSSDRCQLAAERSEETGGESTTGGSDTNMRQGWILFPDVAVVSDSSAESSAEVTQWREVGHEPIQSDPADQLALEGGDRNFVEGASDHDGGLEAVHDSVDEVQTLVSEAWESRDTAAAVEESTTREDGMAMRNEAQATGTSEDRDIPLEDLREAALVTTTSRRTSERRRTSHASRVLWSSVVEEEDTRHGGVGSRSTEHLGGLESSRAIVGRQSPVAGGMARLSVGTSSAALSRRPRQRRSRALHCLPCGHRGTMSPQSGHSSPWRQVAGVRTTPVLPLENRGEVLLSEFIRSRGVSLESISLPSTLGGRGRNRSRNEGLREVEGLTAVNASSIESQNEAAPTGTGGALESASMEAERAENNASIVPQDEPVNAEANLAIRAAAAAGGNAGVAVGNVVLPGTREENSGAATNSASGPTGRLWESFRAENDGRRRRGRAVSGPATPGLSTPGDSTPGWGTPGRLTPGARTPSGRGTSHSTRRRRRTPTGAPQQAIDAAIEMALFGLGPNSGGGGGRSGVRRTHAACIPKEADSGISSEEEGVIEEQLDLTCCVCMISNKRAAFIPCGHTFCRKCAREVHMARGRCPLCNRRIREILKLF